MRVHCTRLVRLIAWVLIVAPIRVATAQTDTTASRPNIAPRRAICWRPRPLPECGLYVPTEFSYEQPIASTSVRTEFFEDDDFEGRFVMAVGLMKNRGERSAFGALVASSSDDPEAFGLLRAEGRYRRWLGERTGVDVGLGYAQKWVYSEGGNEDVQARGVTAGVGIDFGYVGLDARVDRLSGGGRSQNGAFVGVHAGAQAAPAAAGVVAVAIVLVIIAWIADVGG